MQRQLAVESHEQVLAVRVDAAHGAPVQALGPAVGAVARVRRADLIGDAVEQHRSDAARRVVDRVALGHGSTFAQTGC